MNKPKPNPIIIVAKYATIAVILMIVAGCWMALWGEYHWMKQRIHDLEIESSMKDMRYEIQAIHSENLVKEARNEGLALQPIEKPKDGAE